MLPKRRVIDVPGSSHGPAVAFVCTRSGSCDALWGRPMALTEPLLPVDLGRWDVSHGLFRPLMARGLAIGPYGWVGSGLLISPRCS